MCLKVLRFGSFTRIKDKGGGLSFFGPDFSPKGSWQLLYKLIVEKTNSRPPVEDCAWGNSHRQIQSTH